MKKKRDTFPYNESLLFFAVRFFPRPVLLLLLSLSSINWSSCNESTHLFPSFLPSFLPSPKTPQPRTHTTLALHLNLNTNMFVSLGPWWWWWWADSSTDISLFCPSVRLVRVFATRLSLSLLIDPTPSDTQKWRQPSWRARTHTHTHKWYIHIRKVGRTWIKWDWMAERERKRWKERRRREKKNGSADLWRPEWLMGTRNSYIISLNQRVMMTVSCAMTVSSLCCVTLCDMSATRRRMCPPPPPPVSPVSYMTTTISKRIKFHFHSTPFFFFFSAGFFFSCPPIALPLFFPPLTGANDLINAELDTLCKTELLWLLWWWWCVTH